ncbi:hypothetical protein GGR51DRAFT_572716 [Nemania sp. FL0031]|nr:hypothetical protein GGR51DRAFT_572716 [Nemania sp. FL0031]
MDSEGQIRAEWAISNQTVHHWLRSRRSRCVLINGNSTLERISPISFFCAMLIKGLNVIKPIHVLSYFCDINAGGQRMPRGKDLLKSLTSQLIAQWKSGPLNCLSQQEVEELHYTASRPSIRFLRSVFQRLVVTLPAGTPLFIIIDGIDYYETTHLSKDTKSVVKEITGLADKEEVKALVKLVITSANRALDVSKYFSDDEKVWVPETLSSGRVFKWISNDN